MVANSLRWTTRDLAAIPDDGGWKRYEIIVPPEFMVDIVSPGALNQQRDEDVKLKRYSMYSGRHFG